MVSTFSRVSIVEPGPVMTALATKVVTEYDVFENSDAILKDLFAIYSNHLTSMASVMQSPEEIAQLHLAIILSEDPHLRYQTSAYVTEMATSKLKDTTTDGVLDQFKHYKSV